jgi:D-alanine-D-alanine ligase
MIIEVNTLPGMTDMSLFPDAARYVGISYEDLVEKILEYGLVAHRDLNVM